MKNLTWVIFFVLTIMLLILNIYMNKPATYEEIINSIDEVIKFISPVALFLLGYLGLIQWKNEFTFKQRNKIAEEIALCLLNLKNALHDIRKSWPISTMSDATFIKRNSEDDESHYGYLVAAISFIFTEKAQEDLRSRVDFADRKVEELEQKLEIAAILWDKPDIEKAGDKIFSLYYKVINAIYRIRFAQSFDNWSFEGEEIENSYELSLVLHFSFGTKNKTADELNLVYKEELKSCSDIILEKISGYLY